MENFQVIELQRQRDFSRKVNATFEFIKQNFTSLSKSILVIAGPPVLIGSLLMGSFIQEWFGTIQMAAANPEAYQGFAQNYFIKFLLLFAFILISGTITLCTINNYILLYAEKRTNQIEVSEVWLRVRSTVLMYLGSMILFAVLATVVSFLFTIPMVILGLISPVLIFFGIIILFGGIFYVLVSVSLTFIIQAYEKKNFLESMLRSFRLVQNKWWSTFGLIFILYMIMMVIMYIPAIPFYIVLFVNALHNTNVSPNDVTSSSGQIWITIFIAIYYLLQMLLNTLPNIGIAFQYFNLVELKEAKGLMNEIESFGKPQDTIRPEETF